MQRTNWFTNPNLNGPLDNIHVYGNHKATYNQTSHQLEIVGGSGAYGFDLTVPKNTDFVFACFLWTYNPSAGKICAVYAIDGSNNPNEAAVLNAVSGTNNVLLRFNSGGTGRIRIEFQAGNGNMVNIEKPIVELADEHDAAVGGGASGLLHGGYDAARIGASVGRVVSDDGDELAQASERGHRIWRVERCDRHRERGRDENLLHRQLRIALPLSKHERDQDHNVLARRYRPIPGGACGSGGTRHCRAAQWGEGRYMGIQHDPRLVGGKYDVSGFRSGKGLSDPDRVGDLHARRLGEIAVNGSDVVRRGHDASSLALMGVMA